MLFIGHSHLISVLLAAQERGLPFDAVVFRRLKLKELGLEGPSVRTEQPKELTRGTLRLLEEHRGPVYSFVGKRDHTDFALIAHPKPFDFLLPDEPAGVLDPEVETIPVDALRQTTRLLAKQSIGAARRVQRLTKAPMYHFESPPPASPEWLAEVACWEAIAPSELRLKAWRLYGAVMRDGIESFGGTYVPAPRSACDDRGFLRDDLCRNATHANARYGDLVLEQIEALR